MLVTVSEISTKADIIVMNISRAEIFIVYHWKDCFFLLGLNCNEKNMLLFYRLHNNTSCIKL